MKNKKIIIETKGNDLENIESIIKYIPFERKDLLNYMNHLKSEFNNQLKTHEIPYISTMWTDED